MEILNQFVRNDKDLFVFRLQQSAIFFKNIRENPLKYDVIHCTTYFIMLHQSPIETSLNKKDFAQKQTWYQQTYRKFDSRLSKNKSETKRSGQ